MARSDFHEVAPDTGGGGEYEFTVTEAYFGTSPLYSAKSGSETLFLHWLGTTDREAQPIMVRDDYHPSFSCGRVKGEDWVTLDGGKTASHPSAVHFGAQSRIHELFDRVIGNEENPKTRYTGPGLIPEGHPDDPFENFSDLQAEAWVGLKFKMADVEKTISVPNDNGPGRHDITISYVMPVEFLGKVDLTAAPAPTVTAAPAATAPAAAPAGIHPNVMRARLMAMAKSAPSVEAFSAQVMEVDGIAGFPDLLNEVFDEGPAGLFAQAHLA